MPKKQHRVVKKRIPREQQGRVAKMADEVRGHGVTLTAMDGSVATLTRMVDALIEAIGQDVVRKAGVRLASRRSREALAQHVANGKLVEVDVIAPVSCAVELSEHTLTGEMLNESVVAELVGIEKAHQEILVGARVGEMRELGQHKVQVRRVWDVVTP